MTLFPADYPHFQYCVPTRFRRNEAQSNQWATFACVHRRPCRRSPGQSIPHERQAQTDESRIGELDQTETVVDRLSGVALRRRSVTPVLQHSETAPRTLRHQNNCSISNNAPGSVTNAQYLQLLSSDVLLCASALSPTSFLPVHIKLRMLH